VLAADAGPPMATLLALSRAWAGARSACAWLTAQHPALAARRRREPGTAPLTGVHGPMARTAAR
jgi:hypothetical protein